ncbi:hypothetical protein RK21_00626 [Pseudomonas plecoglossicida]|nr:hypothetical protein RK21_00626 [Pseudomonas plecoglossicida]
MLLAGLNGPPIWLLPGYFLEACTSPLWERACPRTRAQPLPCTGVVSAGPFAGLPAPTGNGVALV